MKINAPTLRGHSYIYGSPKYLSGHELLSVQYKYMNLEMSNSVGSVFVTSTDVGREHRHDTSTSSKV